MKKSKQLEIDFLEFGISNLSIIPMRVEPNERAEMVNQVLFGEIFEVLRVKQDWANIRLEYDNYMGWVDLKMITSISRRLFNIIKGKNKNYTQNIVTLVKNSKEKKQINILTGSVLPFFNGKRSFRIKDKKFAIKGSLKIKDLKIRDKIISDAKEFLEAPYLWGGRTAFGIDCSGFSQIVYKINGLVIPRDASRQVKIGVSTNFLSDSKPGDLAFFDNNDGSIIHVGILLGDNRIIHASGKVRIDKIDHNGIYNVDKYQYTHKLRVIKDVISIIKSE